MQVHNNPQLTHKKIYTKNNSLLVLEELQLVWYVS